MSTPAMETFATHYRRHKTAGRLRLAVAAAALLLVSADVREEPVDESRVGLTKRQAHQEILGVWQIDRTDTGRRSSAVQWRFEDDVMSVISGQRVTHTQKFRYDPDKKPPQLDMIKKDGVRKCICTIFGDTLRVRMQRYGDHRRADKPRPKSFDDSQGVLVVLKRVRP